MIRTESPSVDFISLTGTSPESSDVRRYLSAALRKDELIGGDGAHESFQVALSGSRIIGAGRLLIYPSKEKMRGWYVDPAMSNAMRVGMLSGLYVDPDWRKGDVTVDGIPISKRLIAAREGTAWDQWDLDALIVSCLPTSAPAYARNPSFALMGTWQERVVESGFMASHPRRWLRADDLARRYTTKPSDARPVFPTALMNNYRHPLDQERKHAA